MRIENQAPDRIAGDVVTAFFFEDQRPLQGSAELLDWRLNGVLTRLLLDGNARGAPGEFILVRSNGKLNAAWALFAGGGKRSHLAPFTYSGLIEGALEHCRRAGFRRIALCLSALVEQDDGWLQDLAQDLLGPGQDEQVNLTVLETFG
ncbi:MAG: M17 family peptidase N-terminal domain-containing protein [Syntrophotaleaceae bacterium]